MTWNKRLGQTYSLDKQRWIQKDGTVLTLLGTLRETASTKMNILFLFFNTRANTNVCSLLREIMSAHGNIKICELFYQISLDQSIQLKLLQYTQKILKKQKQKKNAFEGKCWYEHCLKYPLICKVLELQCRGFH